MNKIVLAALAVIILALAILGAFLLAGGGLPGGDTLPSLNDSHFSVTSVICPPYFDGENVIVRAGILDDEPARETAVPTVQKVSATDAAGKRTETAVPTIIVKMVSGNATHMVTATLRGGSVNLSRSKAVTLTNNESTVLAFDFGPVPAGAYVVTVVAPSYKSSTKSASLSVAPAPLLGQWVATGEAAFMLVNLQHDSVDVIVRNDGASKVTFGGPYGLFVNVSDRDGVALQGLDQAIVPPGQTVTLHAVIPLAGSYYLDHFAIKVPGRSALIRVPVDAQISPDT